MFGRRKEIAALALSHQLPSIHSFAPEAGDGGLMSYGPDLAENYRRAAALADRVLKGARPADLPVEEPTHFTLCVNLKTAKAMGHFWDMPTHCEMSVHRSVQERK